MGSSISTTIHSGIKNLMARFFLKVGIFLILFIACNTAIGNLLDRCVVKNMDEKLFWSLSQKGKVFDYAFIGTSRVWDMLDPQIIEEVLGGRAINLACESSGFDENLFVLRKLVASNTIKALLVQVDPFILSRAPSLKYHVVMPYVNDPAAQDIVLDNFLRDNIHPIRLFFWRKFPFLKYMEFNYHYCSYLQALFGRKINDFDATQGYRFIADDTLQEAFTFEERALVQDPFSVKYLHRIAAFAREHGIRLVFYTAPILMSPETKPGLEGMTDIISQIAKQDGVTYINMMELKDVQQKQLWLDISHLKKSGAAMASKLLAESLKSIL